MIADHLIYVEFLNKKSKEVVQEGVYMTNSVQHTVKSLKLYLSSFWPSSNMQMITSNRINIVDLG